MIMKSVENYLMFESFQWLKNLAICIILTVFGRSTKVPTRCIFFNTHTIRSLSGNALAGVTSWLKLQLSNHSLTPSFFYCPMANIGIFLQTETFVIN